MAEGRKIVKKENPVRIHTIEYQQKQSGQEAKGLKESWVVGYNYSQTV